MGNLSDLAQWIIGKLAGGAGALNTVTVMLDKIDSDSYDPDFQFEETCRSYLDELEELPGCDGENLQALHNITATYSFIMNQVWNMEPNFLAHYTSSSLWITRGVLQRRALEIAYEIDMAGEELRAEV